MLLKIETTESLFTFLHSKNKHEFWIFEIILNFLPCLNCKYVLEELHFRNVLRKLSFDLVREITMSHEVLFSA